MQEVCAPVLGDDDRARYDDTNDAVFYEHPRFVHHLDAAFRGLLTDLYARFLRPQMRVLDLCSSWVSHLPSPDQLPLAHVLGHGMNAMELDANPRLTDRLVKDLNHDPSLPVLENQGFDAVLVCAGFQYLVWPEQVFREVSRILQPGGVVIVHCVVFEPHVSDQGLAAMALWQ